MVTDKELEQKIAEILPSVKELRHELHRIPEIAGHEFKTSALIRKKLAPLDLQIHDPFLKTDVVALLNPEKKKNLTLRADIDALPVQEKNQSCPYHSEHSGMMHACGHDGHTSMLYGAALILSEIREELPCSVRFLFQPGEEMMCMAKPLLEAGALKDPEPDFITGLHNWPNEPYGKICTKPGVLMAAAGFFTIILHGKGGHGGEPHLANNPIECAADLIAACRSIVPEGCVLSFCMCSAGTNNIAIPEQLELRGTIRFLDPEKGEQLVAAFRKTVEEITQKRKIRCDFSCPVPYPPVINRQEDYEAVRSLMTRHAGIDSFHELPVHTMSSEDFSFYLQKYRGTYCHIGTGSSTPLHSPLYDFDDNILAAGIRYFCLTALHLFR